MGIGDAQIDQTLGGDARDGFGCGMLRCLPEGADAGDLRRQLREGAQGGGSETLSGDTYCAEPLHKHQIAALVAAHIRATELLVNDPKTATPMVAKYVGGGRMDPAIIQAAIERTGASFVADPNRIVDGTRLMHDFQAEQGTLNQPVDLEALFDLTVYDSVAAGN